MSESQITIDQSAATVQRPVLFRLPKPGAVDPFFGANRSFWNARILKTPENNYTPEVKSVAVRKKGAMRGCRFINYESALKYFNALAEQQDAETTNDHE